MSTPRSAASSLADFLSTADVHAQFAHAVQRGDVSAAEAALLAGASPLHPITVPKSAVLGFAESKGFSLDQLEKEKAKWRGKGLPENTIEDLYEPAFPAIHGVLYAPHESREALLNLVKNYGISSDQIAASLPAEFRASQDLFESALKLSDFVILNWLNREQAKPDPSKFHAYQDLSLKVNNTCWLWAMRWMHDHHILPSIKTDEGGAWWGKSLLYAVEMLSNSPPAQAANFLTFLDRFHPIKATDLSAETLVDLLESAINSPHDVLFEWVVNRFGNEVFSYIHAPAAPKKPGSLPLLPGKPFNPITAQWKSAKTRGQSDRMFTFIRRAERLQRLGFNDDPHERMRFSIESSDVEGVRWMMDKVKWDAMEALFANEKGATSSRVAESVQGIYALRSLPFNVDEEGWVECVSSVLTALKTNGLPVGSKKCNAPYSAIALHEVVEAVVWKGIRRSPGIPVGENKSLGLRKLLLAWIKNCDDINVQDSEGNTVLHVVEKALVKAKENLSINVLESGDKIHVEHVLSALIDHGASPFLVNARGQLPNDSISIMHREQRGLMAQVSHIRNTVDAPDSDVNTSIVPPDADGMANGWNRGVAKAPPRPPGQRKT